MSPVAVGVALLGVLAFFAVIGVFGLAIAISSTVLLVLAVAFSWARHAPGLD